MASIQEQLRAYGIQPVPMTERRLGFTDTFVLWWDLGVSFLVMVVGMFLVPGLNLAWALAAIVLGAVLGNTLLGLVGTIVAVLVVTMITGRNAQVTAGVARVVRWPSSS